MLVFRNKAKEALKAKIERCHILLGQSQICHTLSDDVSGRLTYFMKENFIIMKILMKVSSVMKRSIKKGNHEIIFKTIFYSTVYRYFWIHYLR